MKIPVHLGGKVVSLIINDLDDEVNVDNLTKIDHSNLYGEAVTISALLNKIGLFLGEAESNYETQKLELSIYESELRKKYRRHAVEHGGKFEDAEGDLIKLTESSLTEALYLDKAYKIKKKNVIGAKKNLDFVDKLYWSLNSKDKKLNNLVKGVTPEELASELVDGSINSILIRKERNI